ncbi:MAG: hypothetical protein K8T20_05860 [Planctomycetes bacterium]|nr:hypothetical protein [Planctomycetota bacterium]
MMDSQLVRAVARMALDFQSRSDVSMKTLLEASGYLAAPDAASVERLEMEFKRHPDLVESWLRNSDDTRSSPAWYVRSLGDSWEVGRCPGGPQEEFRDLTVACATYVKRHVEQMRGYYGKEWSPLKPST